MNRITDRESSEALLQPLAESILNAYSYKQLLNDAYDPERYLFLESGPHLLPVVVRDGLATFYGGTRHNAANRVPDDPEFLNEALRLLLDEGLRFQFVCVHNDPFRALTPEFRRFDVPYKVEWRHTGIRAYTPERLTEGYTGKALWSWKRIFRNRQRYTFQTLDFGVFHDRFDRLMQAHNAYFTGRDKSSVWAGFESLLLQILTSFYERHRLLIRLVSLDGEPRAIYTIVHNAREMIYFFGGSLHPGDHYISKIMYLDLLEEAQRIAVDSGLDTLNGLAGAFTNKAVFGFSPHPLYALVHDPAWVVQPDPDVEPDLYFRTYGRRFGCQLAP